MLDDTRVVLMMATCAVERIFMNAEDGKMFVLLKPWGTIGKLSLFLFDIAGGVQCSLRILKTSAETFPPSLPAPFYDYILFDVSCRVGRSKRGLEHTDICQVGTLLHLEFWDAGQSKAFAELLLGKHSGIIMRIESNEYMKRTFKNSREDFEKKFWSKLA